MRSSPIRYWPAGRGSTRAKGKSKVSRETSKEHYGSTVRRTVNDNNNNNNNVLICVRQLMLIALSLLDINIDLS